MTNVIDGVTVVCENGVCRMLEPEATADAAQALVTNVAQGYLDVPDFLAFLTGVEPGALPQGGWALFLAALLGGLALNLTPCVLPMVPVNLLVVGKSFRRGLLYGLGIALAFGTLGVLASVGGLAFGTLQAHPLFNAAVACVFAVLGLSLFGVFPIDFTALRPRGRPASGALFAFAMGALSALLAGACVAPVLVSVLLLTAKLVAAGRLAALFLPFVLGLGMALPWPLLGAGFRVLPRPGAWMRHVNRLFALIVFLLAAHYAGLAVRACAAPAAEDPAENAHVRNVAAPGDFSLEGLPRPVLVDCWASWCKNCAAMERGTLRDPAVRDALKNYTVIRLRAEDIRELRALPGFESIRGLPAFVIFR